MKSKENLRAQSISAERAGLLSEWKLSRMEYLQANELFNRTVDPLLIDSAIYRMESAQLRCRYLMDRVRQLEADS